MAAATLQERVESLEQQLVNLRESKRRDLRDYFAGQALLSACDAVCTDLETNSADLDDHIQRHVKAAYLLADAMLAERAK